MTLDERPIMDRRQKPTPFLDHQDDVMPIEPIQPSLFGVPAPGTSAGLRAVAGKPVAEALAGVNAPPPPELSEPVPVDDVPPPALAAVREASRTFEELREHGRELRFETTNFGVRIEVYDGRGRLVREIPPNEALALAAGESSWQA